MNQPIPPEAIAAARAYEGLHVPALFQQWAPRVLDAIQVGPGERVLDVACGTGVLGREAARRVGPEGQVAGVDPAPGMLEVARELEPSVTWREGAAEALPFEDRSFDAVVSQFGLMFFNDRPRAVEEMLRVLVPGGRLAVAVWDALENSAAYPLEVELLERLAGTPAADALRAPFVMGDPAALTALFEEAGAASVTVSRRIGTARFPDIRTMVEADLKGWLPVMGVHLAEPVIKKILAESERVLAEYVTPEGEAVFDAPALVVTGRRPGGNTNS